MKQPALLLPLLAAALLASCASNEWGHATVRTKTAPIAPVPPPVQNPLPAARPVAARPAPAPAVAPPAPAVQKPAAPAAAPATTRPEPRPRTPMIAPAAQNSPVGCPAQKPVVRSQRPTPPQNNPQLHRKTYPTMPGQNRGLQSLSAQRGY